MIGDGEKTGFHQYEDLPVTEQEQALIDYHKKAREQKIESSPTMPDSRSKQRMPMNKKSTPQMILTPLILADIYKDAIEKNLAMFAAKYNAQDTGIRIDLALTLNKRIFDEAKNGAVAQAAVAVEIKENGIGRILINKVYNFSHTRQLQDEGEWKLTLYAEILYELVGGTITLALMTNPENEIRLKSGNKNKEQTSE